jgi:hypothetical protein
VDPEDATLLALNRCAESLLLRGAAPPSAFGDFHRWKLWLDAPLAWLAAEGRYTPRREDQLSILRDMGASWANREGARLVAGAEHGLRLCEKLRRSPIDGKSLQRLGMREQDARSADPARALREWVWPFVRALILRDRAATEEERLQRAFELAVPDSGDAGRFATWLRRENAAARLRCARRWAPQGPRGLTRWWVHGWGGPGPDRVRAACALRWAGAEGWERMLARLVPSGVLSRKASVDEGAVDGWLGGLWSTWIMGGARR